MQPRFYWQVHKISFLLEKKADERLKEQVGVGFAQYKVMEAVGRNMLAKQNTIANLLDQTEASISRQIKLLQNKELLVAANVMGNKRARELSLTEKGEDILQQCEEILDFVQAKFISGLSFEEQEMLKIILDKTINNISNN